MRLRVIGVGSGVGDDAAGLAVIEWLATHAPALALLRCERPLPDLVDALADADAAIVVDAARGAAPVGSVRAVEEREIASSEGTSSHGFGAQRAVALARALGRAPERLAWIAIGIGVPEPGGDLSPPVRAAVPRAGRLVLETLQRFEALTPEGSLDA